VLREQFLRVHTEFNLPKFLEDVKKGAPGIRFTEKNAPPTPGSLDLVEVLKSEYFFS
jgi:DNA-directed RNA polymerase